MRIGEETKRNIKRITNQIHWSSICLHICGLSKKRSVSSVFPNICIQLWMISYSFRKHWNFSYLKLSFSFGTAPIDDVQPIDTNELKLRVSSIVAGSRYLLKVWINYENFIGNRKNSKLKEQLAFVWIGYILCEWVQR